MPRGARIYYDIDTRPSRSRATGTDDKSIPIREVITYDDTDFLVLDEVSDSSETVWNKLEDIGTVTEHTRSNRHVKVGKVELSKTDKDLGFGKYDTCREASKSTKSERYTDSTDTSSRKRRYNQCEKANDKSEDVRNFTIDVSGPKRKPFDDRGVHYSENIKENCHRMDQSSQNTTIDNTVRFPDSQERNPETNLKRDRRSKPHKSYNRKQMSDTHNERHVQFDDHKECTSWRKSGESNTLNRNDPVLYDNELSIEAQTELTENTTAMECQYSTVINRSILPYSDFTKKKQPTCFQYNDQRTFQNNGSIDRNIPYNDRGSTQIEHQSENYNPERDIPDSIVRDGKFENDANFWGEVCGNEIHVNPNFILPWHTSQNGIHVQNRRFQEKRYFNTNIVPMSGHIPQFNTYDNVTNSFTKLTNANITIQPNDNASNNIAKSASTYSHKDIVTVVNRTEGRSYNNVVIDLIKATLPVGEVKLKRNMTALAKEDSKQSEINEQTYLSNEYKTHEMNVHTHDDEKPEVDLSVLPEYIPLVADIKLITGTGDTGHASPNNIQTTDPVAEQVISSCVDIVEANTTTEDIKEGTMIENNSKTNSNTLHAVIEYHKTGKHSDSISVDRSSLPSWTPLKYERRDNTLDINKDDEDFDDKSNQNCVDQNELTISNGKSTTETLFQDVDGDVTCELTGISMQQINSNPPNVSRIMQRSDIVITDASVEKQDFETDNQHEMQAKKNMQTRIAYTETEKNKPDTEKDHELSSTTILCITDQTTMAEECDMVTSEEVSDHVDIIDTNTNIPSAMNTIVAFESKFTFSFLKGY